MKEKNNSFLCSVSLAINAQSGKVLITYNIYLPLLEFSKIIAKGYWILHYWFIVFGIDFLFCFGIKLTTVSTKIWIIPCDVI